MKFRRGDRSIRRRLIWQLLVAAALLAVLLYLSIRSVAESAVELTQDRILGAATLAIAAELRGGDVEVDIDIPYSAFSMLGAMGNDRIFYRIEVGNTTATGYDTLPMPAATPTGLDPIFYSSRFQQEAVRIAAVSRSVLVNEKQVPVLVLVAQTRTTQASIVASMANRAAMLGIGFFAIAAVLAVLTARSVIQPLGTLAEAVARRGPQDLRPVERPVPVELQPMVQALNGFIGRLSGALSRTETFIAEAAHYIRTPLTTLRTQSEIALHQSDDPATSDSLRKIIRLADDTARSAGQLLDHAAVIYRTDQRSDTVLDLAQVLGGVLDSQRPTAELRDISLELSTQTPGPQVWADPVLIEAVLRNLIDNAIKYSQPDTSIQLTVAQAQGAANVSVSDEGRGLGGRSQDDLIKRYGRGDNVGDVVGSGLGLSIVSDVARAYGGTFTITDQQKGGTCAVFSLPLA